ncbi:MAG TPA: glycoside hydrolase family 20 zincin-like fold domain-containing protein [Thermomicrobiales bacterium]|nr:glycoside hydrolase family 20 zincin-like fold domain-containing protein [Thermomicrobiales bacterium]
MTADQHASKTALGAGAPPLIPLPTSLAPGEGAFPIDAATAIVLGADAGDETLFAARQVQAAVREAGGLEAPVGKAYDPAAGANRIALLLAGRDTDAGEAGGAPEGYRLTITPERVTVVAATEAGLFYGVQTLRQLLRTQGRRLPALTIEDRPALPHRGVMLDVSRGKVPTLDTLRRIVDTLAAYKYNHVQLYTEHTFQFPSHPLVGRGAGSLSGDDMIALDRYCRERHVELVPNLQSFGHLRAMLGLPEYAALDEAGWRWSVTPAREETYRLFDELYGDLLPAFTSRWLNIDCDETWDLGMGQTKQLVAERGLGRVYLGHILRLRELAAKHGRRVMLWADVLNHHPELLPELPEDLLLLDWHYEAAEHYPTLDALGRSGRAFWVCPGTSTWNTLFPRLDNALGNIRNFTREGLAAGATGMLLTDWGDIGHYQPLSNSWYPYLYGAATAWTGAKTTPEEFDRAFAPLFLGRPAGDAAIAAMRRLGRAVAGPTIGLPNRSNSAYALFDDPLTGKLLAQADPDALGELRDAATALGAACAALPDAELRHDALFTVREIVFGVDKTRLGQRIRATLRALAADGAPPREEGLARLDGLLVELAAVRAAVPALAAEFEARWLRHARRSEIHLTLDRFTALAGRCDAALAWLQAQRDRYAAGGEVDAGAAGYDPGEYLVLWDEGAAGVLRLVEIAGLENLPPDLREYAERLAAARDQPGR